MSHETISVTVGEQTIIFETGKIARQANGAVLVRCGDTIVFNTACATTTPGAVDFLPLKVDYQEPLSATGKTNSGFIKRQGRPSEREILVSRLIDRPLRPMFEDGYFCEVQVLSYVWSYDGVNLPDPLAICGCSAALVLSDIPLIKPVAGVRVGLVDGQFILNPTNAQQRASILDLSLAGTEDGILMIEGFCDFLTEEQIIEAIDLGHSGIKKICAALSAWQQKLGKPKNR
ncbi:MAG: polyribonucleotide nucleotidyltransferase, partial [Parachlamydiaceae bacterium]